MQPGYRGSALLVRPLCSRVPLLRSCKHSVDAATAEDVDTSVTRAHAAYQSGVWSRAPLLTRSTVLSRLARLLEEHTPTMANIETLQTGRAIREMTAQIGRLPEWLCVIFSVR